MSDLDDLIARLAPQQPQQPGQPPPPPGVRPFEAMGRAGGSIADFVFGRDPAFSQEGVPKFGFRAGLSAADTPEERAAYLSGKVGQGGWTTDKYGNYALTPQGMGSLGLTPGDKPTLIDAPLTEKGIELGDIADIRGDLPAIAGGVGAGLMATGAGAPLGIAASAGGAGLGKLIDELAESAAGNQLQTPGEIARDVGMEAALGGTGEAVYRGVLAPIGRKLMAPQAKRITPESRELWESAQEMGVPLRSTTVTRAPLLSTTEQIATAVLGKDPILDSGRKAVHAEVKRLTSQFGKGNIPKEALGELIVSDIRASRRALSRDSAKWFGRVDDLAQGKPMMSTQRLKSAAADILDDFPRGADGQPLFTQGEGVKGVLSAVQDIQALPDAVTVTDLWNVEKTIRDLGDIYNLAPGKSAHYSGMLGDAINQSYDEVVKGGKGEAVDALRGARKKYSNRIKSFNNATVRRIIRDPKLAGSLTPTQISEFAAGGLDPAKIARIKSVVAPETWEEVQRLSMEKMLSNITQHTKDPLEDVLTGGKLLKELDKYGKPSLDKMFGKETADGLMKLGRVTQAVEYKSGNRGQLIAAAIAASPIANLGRIMQLNFFSRLVASKRGQQWLTTGIKAPKTRAGAEAISRIVTDLNMMADSDIPNAPVKPEQSEAGM